MSGSLGVAARFEVDELKALGYLGRADAGSETDVPESSLLPDPKDKIREANLLHRAMMASEGSREADAREALPEVLNVDPKSSMALMYLGELERSLLRLRAYRDVSSQQLSKRWSS